MTSVEAPAPPVVKPPPPKIVPRLQFHQAVHGEQWLAKARRKARPRIPFNDLQQVMESKDYATVVAACDRYHLVTEHELYDMKHELRRRELGA